MSNFITDCIAGNALIIDIDDYIAKWHELQDDVDLHEYLGMSKKEYELFVDDENYLGLIISAHRNKTSLESIIRNEMSMAARSDNPAKTRRLQQWLESEGLWE